MRKFWHKAFLNEEGKKLFGHIFPSGDVPVLSMIPTGAEIGGEDVEVYLVYHEELTEEQVNKLLEMLANKFDIPVAEIRAEMEKHRIPLRKKYTDASGTNHMGLFL